MDTFNFLYAKIVALRLFFQTANDIMAVCNVDLTTAMKIMELPGFPVVDAVELKKLAPSIRLEKTKK